MDKHSSGQILSTGRYILIGCLTAAPLGITWLIVNFLYTQLSTLGRPWVQAVSRTLLPHYPRLADWILDETLQSAMAAIVVLAFLYILGWGTTRVIGQRLIDMFEGLIERIPFVDTIYRSTKKFINVAGHTPQGERRVVLINFPSREMKTIGLITRILKDSASGEDLAVVYVPTAPNPTSGYIEIVPVRDVIYTDWTFDQAMAFVITGGSNAPESLRYTNDTPTTGG